MDLLEKIVFDDTQITKSLSGLIDQIETLDFAFDKTTNSIKSDSDKIAKTIVDNSNKINKSIGESVKASVDFANTQKTIGEVAIAIAKNSTQAEKLLNVYKKLQEAKKQGVVLDSQDVDELTEGFNKMAKEVGLTQNQLDTLLTNMEAVVTEVKKLDTPEFKNAARDAELLTSRFSSAKTELRQLTNLINSGQLSGDDLKRATIRAAELKDTIGDVSDEIKQLSSDTRGLDLLVEGTAGIASGFQLAEGAMQLLGDESQDMQKSFIRLNAIMAIANGLQEAGALLTRKGGIATLFSSGAQSIFTVAIGASTGALRIFKIALAATGIGLIILLLGALVSNFDSVKKSITGLFPGLANLKAVFFGVIDGIVAGFKGIANIATKVFTGDFSGAIGAAKNLGSSVGEAYNKGVSETIEKDANKAFAKVIEKTVENQKRRLAVLDAGGKDTYALQKTILTNELAALKLHGKNTEEAKKEILDKQNELDVLAATKQKEISDKAKESRDNALKSLGDIKDSLFDLSKQYKLIGDQEAFDIVKAAQLKQLTDTRDELTKVGKLLGKDVSPQVAYFNQLIAGLEARDFSSTLGGIEAIGTAGEASVEKFRKELEKLENIEAKFGLDLSSSKESLEKSINSVLSIKSDKPLDIAIPKVNVKLTEKPTGLEKMAKDLELYLRDIDDFDGLFSQFLTDIFGDENGVIAGEALGALGSFVTTLSSIADEAAEIQLGVLDKQIDSVQKRRETLQKELEDGLEDQKLGLANNVGDKKAQVDSLIEEETRLAEEQERIKKETQLRQLRLETVTQAASLITTSIEIIKGFSSIPIIGLPLGIAAVATMFGFFAKAKADAFKATKLYTSTGDGQIKDFFGFPAKQGETDLPGRGLGYRLWDERTQTPTNVIVSGREMVLDEATSMSQASFFDALRSGQYAGIDLHEAMGMYKQFKSLGGKFLNPAEGFRNTTSIIKPSKKSRQFVAIPYTSSGKQKAVLLEVDDETKNGQIVEFE